MSAPVQLVCSTSSRRAGKVWNGSFIDASDSLDVTDPATGETLSLPRWSSATRSCSRPIPKDGEVPLGGRQAPVSRPDAVNDGARRSPGPVYITLCRGHALVSSRSAAFRTPARFLCVRS
jgi:hypothetical protein